MLYLYYFQYFSSNSFLAFPLILFEFMTYSIIIIITYIHLIAYVYVHIYYIHTYIWGGRLCVFCSSLLQDQNIRSWRDLIKNTQCSGGGDKGSGSKQLNDFKTSQKLVIFTRPFPSQAYVSSKNHWGTFWDKLSFLEDSQTSWAAWRKQKLAKLLRRGSKQLSYQARTLSNLLCYLEIV